MDIGVVLVTFNRLGELKKALRLYEQQTKPPRYVLVVDNHSTDGTGGFLEAWQKAESPIRHLLITLPENAGGSGGFSAGTKAALDLDADWIWLADDDAYPDRHALETLSLFAENHAEIMENTAALCTKVENSEGIATAHRCYVKKTPIGLEFVPVPSSMYKNEYFPLDAYSFVGAVIRKDALLKAGLPDEGFFIYMDDREHALRVRRVGQILCVPAAEILHQDGSNLTREASWRDYYTTRNILLTYKRHFGWSAFCVRAVRRMLAALASFNGEKIRMFWEGVNDARRDRTGVHPVYRPGWQSSRKK